jgi:nucleotide-binding universal stress UspA family protein
MSSPRNAQLPRRIIVGLDEMGLADAAVRAALSLSNALDAKLEIVHVMPAPPERVPNMDIASSTEQVARLTRTMHGAARAHVQALLTGAKQAHRSVDEILRFVGGRAAHVLLAESRSPTDLIMLGAKRRAGVHHIGGTLRTLLARAVGPVWVQNVEYAGVRRILVPIDMSPPSMQALHVAIALATKLDARIHVVHSFVPTYPIAAGWGDAYGLASTYSIEDLRDAVRTSFEQSLAGVDWTGVAHEQTFIEGDPVSSILAHSATCDLIAMGTHGHSGLAAAVLGNVAWAVMERGDKPLLVTHLTQSGGQSRE